MAIQGYELWGENSMMWEHPHEGWLFRAMNFGGKNSMMWDHPHEGWLFRAMSFGGKTA